MVRGNLQQYREIPRAAELKTVRERMGVTRKEEKRTTIQEFGDLMPGQGAGSRKENTAKDGKTGQGPPEIAGVIRAAGAG